MLQSAPFWRMGSVQYKKTFFCSCKRSIFILYFYFPPYTLWLWPCGSFLKLTPLHPHLNIIFTFEYGMNCIFVPILDFLPVIYLYQFINLVKNIFQRHHRLIIYVCVCVCVCVSLLSPFLSYYKYFVVVVIIILFVLCTFQFIFLDFI